MSARMMPFAIPTLILGILSNEPAALAASNKVVTGMGHDLTQRLCSSCHLIEPGQTNPADHVGGPAFQTIADRPDTTRASLEKHLRTTHASMFIPLSMPNPALTDDETTKIVSYILDLHTRR